MLDIISHKGDVNYNPKQCMDVAMYHYTPIRRANMETVVINNADVEPHASLWDCERV